ncbi:DNA-binding GntR family transcriptional regulator [Bosea sp. OAE752]|jgi:DNA-binding GntR family transcriptional regulator|uniref:GntR family transcriptional regulator n=1 Tax=unclassified Bosea (in: a-proteobacteria) TaxID=2653178 RepID=UPI000690FD11|nr:GntR family transcriptional regulator [Bosea sp. UNC402CLCol]
MVLVTEQGGRTAGEAGGKRAAGGSASRARELAKLIEKDISTGRLSAGSWLKQVDLEAQYSASRLDIRQALDRLEEKGFVKLEANRGYRVESFDKERFRNVVTIRAILEVAAAAEVLKHIDEAGLQRLLLRADAFAEAVNAGTVVAQEEANYAFHAVMLEFCPNRDLVSMIFDLRSRVPVTLTREKNTAALLANTVSEHYEIVERLRERDKPGLEAVVHKHVMGGLEVV